ncbi:hypothetical protein N665_0944s0020 [Sinapis alba]|nr:hypothetical protein N665_0944s0020 [Sinapis alba]
MSCVMNEMQGNLVLLRLLVQLLSMKESSFFSVVSRLGDLEKQIETLHLKKSEMPHEKEELLNTAVYRVDALEAEFINTKKRKKFC